MWSDADDLALRTAAIDWLRFRTNDGLDAISSADIGDFRFRGQPFRLLDPQRGICKPAVLSSALSIRTTYRPEGAARPYDGDLGPDGLVRYKWRGDDPDHAGGGGAAALYPSGDDRSAASAGVPQHGDARLQHEMRGVRART